eukprot:458387-Amphidinium_carterae.1
MHKLVPALVLSLAPFPNNLPRNKKELKPMSLFMRGEFAYRYVGVAMWTLLRVPCIQVTQSAPGGDHVKEGLRLASSLESW